MWICKGHGIWAVCVPAGFYVAKAFAACRSFHVPATCVQTMYRTLPVRVGRIPLKLLG